MREQCKPQRVWMYVAAILLLIILVPLVVAAYMLVADRLTERNIRILGEALRAYAQNNGAFPDETEILVQQHYLRSFPINPYTMKPMRLLPTKENLLGRIPVSISGGDFSYVHWNCVKTDLDPQGEGFYLSGYLKCTNGLLHMIKEWLGLFVEEWTPDCYSCSGILTITNNVELGYLNETEVMREATDVNREPDI
jgi:hypothetical protein